ncbi:MAG: DUF3634 family protein [Labilithrix sp.]|nr:DUF3634 family protein [Labilithrix sp.]
MDAVYLVAVLALIALALWAATRQNEVFRVTVRAGKATVLRGHVPKSFLGDLREIVAHIDQGVVRAVKQDGQARLVVSGSIDENTAQRLRNAFAVNPANRRL